MTTYDPTVDPIDFAPEHKALYDVIVADFPTIEAADCTFTFSNNDIRVSSADVASGLFRDSTSIVIDSTHYTLTILNTAASTNYDTPVASIQPLRVK